MSLKVRAIALASIVLVLAACNDCKSQCKTGITFFVGDLAGALSGGGKEPLHICFDGDCQDVTVSHDNAGGSVFLPFKGVGVSGEHDLTVSGVGAFKGQYRGELDSYTQAPGGGCKTCHLATVKIGADGKLTPAIAATQGATTTTG